MKSSKFYGMIIKIKNQITLHFTYIFFFRGIVNILLYYSCFYKKTTLKRFLHYMQVYLLFDIVMMHSKAEPEGKTF